MMCVKYQNLIKLLKCVLYISFHQNSIIFSDMTQSYVCEMDYNIDKYLRSNLKTQLGIHFHSADKPRNKSTNSI